MEKIKLMKGLQGIKSANILGASHDGTNMKLQFKKNGRAYQYLEVPRGVYFDFMAAESKGKFFHKHILNKYKCISLIPNNG